MLLFEAAPVQPFLLSLPSACFCRTRASIHLPLTHIPFPRPNALFSCAPPTETRPFPISPLQYFYFFSSPTLLPSPHPHFCSNICPSHWLHHITGCPDIHTASTPLTHTHPYRIVTIPPSASSALLRILPKLSHHLR